MAHSRVVRGSNETALVRLFPHGKWATAVLGGQCIDVIELDTGKSVRQLDTFGGLPGCLAVSHDGAWVGAGIIDPNAVVIWSTHDGKSGPGVPGLWVDSIAFAPGDEWFAVGEHQGAVYMLPMPGNDADSYTLGSHSEGYVHTIPGLAFTPDGAYLVSASANGTVRIWDIRARTEAALITMEEPGEVAVSPDNRWFAVGDAGGIVRVRALPSGDSIRDIKVGEDTVCSVAISCDGRWIASDGGGRQGLVVCASDSGDQVFKADTHVNKYLSFHPEDPAVLVSACNKFEKDGGGVQRWDLPLS